MSTHANATDSRTPRTTLMTVSDAAAFLAVSRRQVYLLVERGDLPTIRVGNRLRFVPEEIWAYLERNREGRSP